MKLMVFLHGTIIMQKSGAGHTRHGRSQQVVDGEESVQDFASYVPIDDAVTKLKTWGQQGAEILYLTFHKDDKGVQMDREVLEKHGFPNGPILFRQAGERYSDVAERALPDILIEDDCECIGGEPQMTYPHIRHELKIRIKSVVVKEFGGIDHLPDTLSELKDF